MKFVIASISIFGVLACSRLIPHPPNFTSLLALSFYVPVFFGLRYLPILLISFAITDLIIGYHTGTHWSWGSVLIIGLMSQYLSKSFNFRIVGALFGALIFFVITNFGVWTSGMYSFTMSGLIECYTMAIPFFSYSLVSTIIFSLIIEAGYKLYKTSVLKVLKKL